MVFNDIREFISEAQRLGEYKLVEGADWNLEIGLITEWQAEIPNSPLLLFDNIKGYPSGYRVVTNLFSTPRRTALALGLPREAKGMELVKEIKDKLGEGFEMIPPAEVDTAPVKENIYLNNEVDLFKFPSPIWHRRSGGRYIGTGDAVIMKDPDGGWINVATYRVQVQSKNTATIFMKPGSHGITIMRKWRSKRLSCPVAIATGFDPVLFSASTTDIEQGISEYDFAGGFRGKPVEVTPGITVDLPIPASAEIVLEGEMIEGETAMEGPFPEYSGYFAGGKAPRPVVRVKAVLHRNNPIIHGSAPLSNIISTHTLASNQRRAANAWNGLDKIVPGVNGVWIPDYAPSASPVIVSVEQQYLGHAKQVAMAVLAVRPTAYLQPFVVVVDDDIDPSNMSEVLWAVTTRCNPATSIDIVRGIRSSPLQPAIDPDQRKRGDFTFPTAVIMACRPYHWREEFPPTIKSSPEDLKKISEKWWDYFK